MIHLKNHFDGSGTYIIGKLISNGCQTFPIEELERVCKEYDVPRELEEQVRQLYYENLKTPEDWDILINDEDYPVRVAVAKQGYGLDKLINDEDWIVRVAVAKQRYGLDILVNDEDWSVRVAVAKQGYGLDKLINDRHWEVRATVAEQGYGLDKLIKDEDWGVRAAAKNYTPKK